MPEEPEKTDQSEETKNPNPATTPAKSSRGGRREGAGRRTLGKTYYKVRLLPEEISAFQALGGSLWLEDVLQKVIAGKTPVQLDTTKMDVAQRTAFVEGWQDAGGPRLGPRDTSCRPWLQGLVIEVRGVDAFQWGRQFWENRRREKPQ